MDVVKRSIEALRGTSTSHSRPKARATFTMRLPLTLAIIDGFLVGVGGAAYVMPLDSVVECIELPNRRGERNYLNLRGEVLPFLRLRELFEVAGAPRRQNVVVVQYGGRQAGLVVDQLMGECQTVIKPLGVLFEQPARHRRLDHPRQRRGGADPGRAGAGQCALESGFRIDVALLVIIAVVSVTACRQRSTRNRLTLVNDRFPKTVQANNVIDAINTIARQLRNTATSIRCRAIKAVARSIAPEARRRSPTISKNCRKRSPVIVARNCSRTFRAARSRLRLPITGQVHDADQGRQKRRPIVMLMQGELRKTQASISAVINALGRLPGKSGRRAGKLPMNSHRRRADD
jgi:hypothetical protein